MLYKTKLYSDDVTDVPEGATVVFSAHGSPPSDYEIAKSRKLNVIDATCPLVTKVHIEARKYEREGRRIVLIGHDGHQEVRGSRGYADVFLVDDRDPEAPLPDWDSDEKVTVLTQTTLSVDDTAKTIERLRNKFKDIIVRGDICYATTNRQRAVKDIAKQMDVFIIIGSDQSSNCIRLKEVAEACGVKSYRINHPDELQQDWFKPGDKIGIASSASTPEKTVSDVVSAIKPTNIHQTGAASENIAFKLPSGVQ